MYRFSPDECGSSWQLVHPDAPIRIATLNHPYHYPNNIVCVWHFVEAEGSSFVIEFLTFDTQRGTDILTVEGENNNVYHNFSSYVSPNVVAVVEESALWLTFRSDIAITGSGFELQVARVFEAGR